MNNEIDKWLKIHHQFKTKKYTYNLNHKHEKLVEQART